MIHLITIGSYIVAFVLLSMTVPQLELGSIKLYFAALLGPGVAFLFAIIIPRFYKAH